MTKACTGYERILSGFPIFAAEVDIHTKHAKPVFLRHSEASAREAEPCNVSLSIWVVPMVRERVVVEGADEIEFSNVRS